LKKRNPLGKEKTLGLQEFKCAAETSFAGHFQRAENLSQGTFILTTFK
jgi:hypothetical protein